MSVGRYVEMKNRITDTKIPLYASSSAMLGWVHSKENLLLRIAGLIYEHTKPLGAKKPQFYLVHAPRGYQPKRLETLGPGLFWCRQSLTRNMPTSDKEATVIRKEQALDLAQLIYDVYIEEQLVKNEEGQNHADHPIND